VTLGAGEYDTRITIQSVTITKDDTYGAATPTWASITASPIWARVRDGRPSRSEQVRQGLELARNQTVIETRYRSDVDSSMRVIVHRATDEIYQIVGGPAEIGRREGLEMVVERASTVEE
jgi:SPP1 family predicted phage head-tail adaptor